MQLIGSQFLFSLKKHFSGKSKNKMCCDTIIWLSLFSNSWKEAGSSCMTLFQTFLCGIFLSFRKPIDMYTVVLNVEWMIKHWETQNIASIKNDCLFTFPHPYINKLLIRWWRQNYVFMQNLALVIVRITSFLSWFYFDPFWPLNMKCQN